MAVAFFARDGGAEMDLMTDCRLFNTAGLLAHTAYRGWHIQHTGVGTYLTEVPTIAQLYYHDSIMFTVEE